LSAAYTEACHSQPVRPEQLPLELSHLYEQEEQAHSDHVYVIRCFLDEVLHGCNPLMQSRSGYLALLGVEGLPGGSNPGAQVELDDVGQRLSAVLHCMNPQQFQASAKYVCTSVGGADHQH
jgi:hypothetical protein